MMMFSKPTGERSRIAPTTVVALLGLAGLGGCGGEADAGGEPGEAHGGAEAAATPKKGVAPVADGTRVEVVVLNASEARLDATIPGEVEGSRDAVLASAQGGPIERVFVKEGQQVKARQLLMHVDTALYTIRHKQAQQDLARAEREFKRAQGLGTALSTAERERRESEVQRLQNALELASLQLDRSKIRAPFAGVVSELHTEVGEVVAATAPLLHLVRLDPIKVVLSVPDRDVVVMSQGNEVEVRVAARSGAVKGSIARISPTGDQETRAFRAEVEVANPDLTLMPGMIASVRVARTVVEGAVVIPQDWLVTRRDGVGVFLEKDGVVHYQPVKAGRVVRDQVIIDEGLSPGARLVVTGHRGLADGDRIVIARQGQCCTAGRAVFD